MAVTRGATVTDKQISANTTNGNFNHTADANTTLMILYVALEGNEGDPTTPIWDVAGDNQTFTVIHNEGQTGANADCRSIFYGLVNPITTGSEKLITMTYETNVNPAWTAAVNFLGTDTSSVANATNFLSVDQNTGATNISVHASAGSAGNALLVGGHGQGNDMQPASNDESFTEIFDIQTGGSPTADFAGYLAELLDSAPSAVEIDWAETDENCSIFIEILVPQPNVASGTPSITAVTATGAALLFPRVFLNTTETKAGATEMTVTAANAAGTSATFTDPSGAPTGSLKLGLENPVSDLIGWIDVTVNAGGATTPKGPLTNPFSGPFGGWNG